MVSQPTEKLPPNLDLAWARRCFREATELFARDGGQLWGISLDGPMIFVDYETRQAVANRPDAGGRLALEGDLWVGRIPPEVILANTATTWAGVHWTMVLWQSLSHDPQERAAFMAHEAFHRVQADLGFPMPEIPNANRHLDTLEGRYLLRLEWRALERALRATGGDQRIAVADALAFRAARRASFPLAAGEERALEMHEGLAEYTGFRLSGMGPARVAEHLRGAPDRYPSFVRSFAYASGPAYGFLLDGFHPSWRVGLTPEHDLGAVLQAALDLVLPDPEERKHAYDSGSLWKRELERERERRVQIAFYRARLLDGPVLILPLRAVQCAFDPRTTVPMPEAGTVFPFIQVRDVWGVLEVESGGLWMADDWRSARIAAPVDPAGRPLRGEGWTLHLAGTWRLEAGIRPGDWVLVEGN